MTKNPFLPDRQRASTSVSRIRERLGRSIVHIADRAQSAVGRNFADEIRARLADARSAPYLAPGLFALHDATLRAVAQGALGRLGDLLQTITAGDWARQHREIIGLDPKALDPNVFSLYTAALDVDASTQVSWAAPSAESLTMARQRIEEALSALRRCSPDLADEVELVLAQVVILSDRSGTSNGGFAGGSSFRLWGAVFLNVDSFKDSTDLLTGIVHEVAHLVLFAEALDEPLVLNDDEEIYPSPLRLDPRPMDGIYHANFVTARMHLALRDLAREEQFRGRIPRKLSSELARLEQLFWSSVETIRKNARLTATGRAVLDSAVGYMSAASAARLWQA